MEATRQSPPRPAVDEAFLDKVQQALEAALRATAEAEALADQWGKLPACLPAERLEAAGGLEGCRPDAREGTQLETDLVTQQAELREWLEHFTELQRRIQTLLHAPVDRKAA